MVTLPGRQPTFRQPTYDPMGRPGWRASTIGKARAGPSPKTQGGHYSRRPDWFTQAPGGSPAAAVTTPEDSFWGDLYSFLNDLKSWMSGFNLPMEELEPDYDAILAEAFPGFEDLFTTEEVILAPPEAVYDPFAEGSNPFAPGGIYDRYSQQSTNPFY